MHSVYVTPRPRMYKTCYPWFSLHFLLLLWRKAPPIIKFYGVFNHFLRTCEVAKSWAIKLYHCVSDVIHANEQTKYVNCGLHVNFCRKKKLEFFCKCHFGLWWNRIILSKSCYFLLRSSLSLVSSLRGIPAPAADFVKTSLHVQFYAKFNLKFRGHLQKTYKFTISSKLCKYFTLLWISLT